MSTKRPGLPEFWTTGLAKLLVGSQPCHFEAWMKGHYRIDKRPREDEGSLAKWKAEHTEQLSKAVKRFRSEGWRCDVERYFKLTGKAAVLTGKADLVTFKDDLRPVIRDVKSGRPADSDVAQVLIYIIAIPMAWQNQMIFDGQVIYPTHTIDITHKEAEALKPKLFALLRDLGSEQRPVANPGESACRFCDVNAQDCPDRFQIGSHVEILTSEF